MPPHDAQKSKYTMDGIDKPHQNYHRVQYQQPGSSGPLLPVHLEEEDNDDTSVNTAEPAVARYNNIPNLALKYVVEESDDSASYLKRTNSNITSNTKTTTGMTSIATQKYSNVKNPQVKQEFNDIFDENDSFDSIDFGPDTSFYTTFDYFCCTSENYGLHGNTCIGTGGLYGNDNTKKTLAQQRRRTILLEKRRRRFQAFTEQQSSYKMDATPRGFEFDEFKKDRFRPNPSVMLE
mmetsp:Transcript_27252/g.54488  ORF Transcript_27252/g.54488 Transcript_27252/m.54488 type:complete len:235 (-) Transcript_27252:332-1036(-)